MRFGRFCQVGHVHDRHGLIARQIDIVFLSNFGQPVGKHTLRFSVAGLDRIGHRFNLALHRHRFFIEMIAAEGIDSNIAGLGRRRRDVEWVAPRCDVKIDQLVDDLTALMLELVEQESHPRAVIRTFVLDPRPGHHRGAFDEHESVR